MLTPLPTSRRIKLPDNQTDFAGVIRNVLTPEECLHLIAMTEKVGYEQATVTTFGDKQVTMTNYRNSSRCIIDSDNLSGVIWERISNLIPNPSQIHSLQREALREGNSETSKSESFLTNITSRLGVGPRESDHWSAYEINHRMRFLRYGSGEYFNRHRDGCYVDRNEDRSRANRRQSWVSFQIYLNEGFEGGATTFMARGENEEQNVSVVPEAGMVVLFSHPIEHQGDLVVSGRKYAIRSDVMYERDGF